ncbi:MAG: hypothetical protein AAB604_00490 [Patescibacteria group bacterium]
MTKTHHEIFEDLLNEAKTDENIIGFFLGGSRGKGYENDLSDYDLHMIVKDEVAEAYKKKFDREMPEIDLSVSSLSEFSEYAKWQSDTHWDRYDFTHVQALVDKTGGEIQKLIDEKGSIPKEKREEFINGSIDAYMNGFFRSVKSYRKKDAAGVRLEAAASIPYLLNALFALHDRATPFANYLSRELKRRPLEKFPWSSERLLMVLLKILKNGDLKTQQELVKIVENTFRREGYGKVFDDWEGKDKWAMSFQSDFKADKLQ